MQITRRRKLVIRIRNSIVALVLASFSVSSSWANAHATGPAFVQVNATSNSGSQTASVTFNANTGQGDLLAVYTDWDNAGGVSISDNQGNTYTGIGTSTPWGSPTNLRSQVFYAKNITGGATTVTATYASSASKDLYVVEYSGLSTTNPIDVSIAAHGKSTTPNSGSIATTNPNDLLFGAGADFTTPTAPGSGYTFRSTYSGNIVQDRLVNTTGSYNSSAKLSSNGQWVMHMVAFKAASTVDTTPPSAPTGLTATPVSSSQIDLSWSASTDNVGVAGYQVYRNGSLAGSPTGTTFSDTSLSPNTTYSYTVAAVDTSQNLSAQSSPATATTQSGTTPHPLFVGDYETNNFNQWPICQNVFINDICTHYTTQQYPMQTQSSVVRQGAYAARFEIRPTDAQPFCCGQRAEVSGDVALTSSEGQDRWYQWSTQFAPGFPSDGWSTVSQWHADSDGPPPLDFHSSDDGITAGSFGLIERQYNTAGGPYTQNIIWQVPQDQGSWHDIKIHVIWSTTDSGSLIELWHNGVRQTFTGACAGQTQCHLRTMVPGGGNVYFKQGYYRDPAITTTGVVYHDGFSMADSESNLQPLQ